MKFLETIPPSTCCSSCLPAGKGNTQSPPHREIIFSPTNKNKSQQESFQRICFPPPLANPSLWGGLKEPPLCGEGDPGHSTPIFPLRAWRLTGCQELGLKKRPPRHNKTFGSGSIPPCPTPQAGLPSTVLPGWGSLCLEHL